MKLVQNRIFSQAAKGFTLIELLVVIVLVGIIATMGVLNLTHWLADREAKQEIQVLHDQISRLMDDAVISQRTLAIKVYPDSIKIYERNEEGWQESLRHKQNQNAMQLSEGIVLSLLQENGKSLASAKGDDLSDLIYLGLDGRVSPYRLRVEDKTTYCDLVGDIAGNIQQADCQKK